MLNLRYSCVFLMSLLMVACGNKGELYLKSETDVDTELEQIDNTIDELDQLEQDTGGTVPSNGDTEKDEDEDEDDKDKESKNRSS